MAEPAKVLGDQGLSFEDAMFDIVKAQDTISETDGALKRIVTGYAAVADVVDSQYEIITKEALDGASKDLLQYTTVLYNHDPDRPIGKVLEARPEGTGLFVKVQISNTEDEIWNKITEGIISKFSFRGTVTDYAEQYEKSLERYVTVIKGFRVFEISLVSVPANPHARTLHYYLSKALETIRNESQSQGTSEKAEDKTPNMGGPRQTMDQETVKSAERMKLIASLCDKLIAALQDMPQVDARLLAVAKRIKAEAQAAAGDDSGKEGYPQPSAETDLDIEGYNPVMEGMKSRIAATEDKLSALEKSITELSQTLGESITETVKSATETLINERLSQLDAKFDTQSDVIKSFAELLDSLRPALGLDSVVEKTESTEQTEEKTNQGGET
jgi:HK97 family phage prohead protease